MEEGAGVLSAVREVDACERERPFCFGSESRRAAKLGNWEGNGLDPYERVKTGAEEGEGGQKAALHSVS